MITKHSGVFKLTWIKAASSTCGHSSSASSGDFGELRENSYGTEFPQRREFLIYPGPVGYPFLKYHPTKDPRMKDYPIKDLRHNSSEQ